MTSEPLTLHELTPPEPISWWPPAPGWYVVGALAFGLLLWGGWRLAVRWRENAYRRAALEALDALDRVDGSPVELAAAVGSLLKRTALVGFPRSEVASLSGEAWLEFLDRTGGDGQFTDGPGKVLASGPYARPDADLASVEGLVAATRRWVRRHRRGEAR